MKKLALILGLALGCAGTAQAGPFTDEMAKCLVTHTSEADKTLLMKWIYAAMSRHPDVAALSNVSSAQAEQLSREIADLLTELVVQRCRTESTQAMRFEGAGAFPASFEVLGRVAMQGLMTDTAVSQYMTGLDRYLDVEKFEALQGH